MKQYPYFQKILENTSQNHFFNPLPICLAYFKKPLFSLYIACIHFFIYIFYTHLYFYLYIYLLPHMLSTMHHASCDVYFGCTLLHPQWSTSTRSHSFPKLTLVCHSSFDPFLSTMGSHIKVWRDVQNMDKHSLLDYFSKAREKHQTPDKTQSISTQILLNSIDK